MQYNAVNAEKHDVHCRQLKTLFNHLQYISYIFNYYTPL